MRNTLQNCQRLLRAGGLVVKIGSQMIDSSIRTRLNTLAHAMKG